LSDRRVDRTAPGLALPSENPAASFLSMSSVGFTSQSENEELEKLREAWRSLADVLRNITSAEARLKQRDYKQVEDHLGVAKWNIFEDLLVRTVFRAIARADDLDSLTVVSPGGVT
jgi:hypothetical protein